MVFSSTLFIFLFLPAVLLIYYICPRKIRNFILLIFSLLFYAWGEPIYLFVMLISIGINYIGGLIISGQINRQKEIFAKLTLIITVILNIGILGFFKYSNFFINNINYLFKSDISLLDIALPIGISFYTFQAMSYCIDVYRRNANVQKNLINFAAYVTMFPQLVAGPIVQYKDIDTQLNCRKENISDFAYGIERFIIGLFKKVILANNLGFLWSQITLENIHSLSAVTAWIGAIAFSLQIYFDFSGYSDMAIGLGNMFGFHFHENFNYPYRSKSITEFWRRWHISLGTWFREYVYIPLGGSRKGTARLIINLIIVWGLTGFWHGASWNFIIWGLYFGLILIIEKLFLLKRLEKLPSWVSHFYALFLIVFGWVIFSFEDIKNLGLYIKAMFGGNHALFLNSYSIYLFKNYAFLLIAGIILSVITLRFPDTWRKTENAENTENIFRHFLYILKLFTIAFLFFISICFLIGDTYNPFLYFRF